MSTDPDDESFMRRAMALAEQAAREGEVPVGAIVVMAGLIVGEGYNRQITTNDPTAHAEVVALRAAAASVGNYRLADADLYVTIEPCTMCAGALVHARIRRLVFGTREPRAGSVVSSASVLANTGLNHRVEIVEGVLAAECATMMREFFRGRR